MKGCCQQLAESSQSVDESVREVFALKNKRWTTWVVADGITGFFLDLQLSTLQFILLYVPMDKPNILGKVPIQ